MRNMVLRSSSCPFSPSCSLPSRSVARSLHCSQCESDANDEDTVMDFLMRLSAQHGVLVVFLAVLLEQLGIPLPAYPILLLSGSLAAHGDLPWPDLLAAAVAASVIADNVWYATGRRYGRRVLGLLCRVSLTPDSCVRQTEATFIRRGAVSLLVAKFVPGFATLATVLSGT